ncbi:FAD-dependent oxidoreductase [Kiritimatiellaeota bacterium B1221]|nr:FAD-dependent oxidoreductase [Kiritimatiellaeota bacterium B1221]
MNTPNAPHYFRPEWIQPTTEKVESDVVIYGGTAAGVIAAKNLAGKGRKVALLNPARHLGGMTTGGLGWTDFGKKGVIGGMSYLFYKDLGAYYGQEEPEWAFEPKAAQAVIDQYAKTEGITVYHLQFLDQVTLENNRIISIKMLGGLEVSGKYFMDCTYEGDLYAKAGVSYHVGREANSVYGETINGVQYRDKHQFSHFVDPYVVPGDPKSGTLPWINEQDCNPSGSGDHRIQAYNFRVCMTDDPELKIDWEKPEGYNPEEYELARRWFNSEKDWYNEHFRNPGEKPGERLMKFDVLGPKTAGGYSKTDTNNHGPVSTDFIGANYAWPEAGYQERERIFQEHVTYIKGHFWFMANDPSIPERYRAGYARWGLSRDEFTDTAHWPHQLYVREGRRMISDYVLNEQDTQHFRQPDDPIAMGSYAMDSHNCQRFVRDGRVMNEGDVQLKPKAPYGVSYRSIIPAKGECENILVPVCLSSSHIAYGSVRMEPVFMAMAHSAAIAADLALESGCALQNLNYPDLKQRLLAEDQVLEDQTQS